MPLVVRSFQTALRVFNRATSSRSAREKEESAWRWGERKIEGCTVKKKKVRRLRSRKETEKKKLRRETVSDFSHVPVEDYG